MLIPQWIINPYDDDKEEVNVTLQELTGISVNEFKVQFKKRISALLASKGYT